MPRKLAKGEELKISTIEEKELELKGTDGEVTLESMSEWLKERLRREEEHPASSSSQGAVGTGEKRARSQ